MAAKHAKSLPVITYHFVNTTKAGLTVSPRLFEEHCRTLAAEGWRGVSLAEAEAFFLHGEALPEKSLLITLDDGYLDNYVYAWPILEKYGHKAVIFAVAEPLNEAQNHAGNAALRPTLKDVWEGTTSEDALPQVNAVLPDSGRGYRVRNDLFFTWAEARAMEKSGVIAIAAHSLYHEGIFCSPEYDGFSRPEEKTVPFHHYVRGDFWGRPRFRTGSELTATAFTPAQELLDTLRSMVPQDEAEAFAFFKDEGNIERLENAMRGFDSLGSMERPEEKQNRLLAVMRRNQEIFTRELGHPVQSFSWPWGHYDEAALAAAKAAGFRVFYTVKKGPNPAGKAEAVHRMNYKDNVQKMLSRIRIYARPLLGALYTRFRI